MFFSIVVVKKKWCEVTNLSVPRAVHPGLCLQGGQLNHVPGPLGPLGEALESMLLRWLVTFASTQQRRNLGGGCHCGGGTLWEEA